MGLQQIQWSQVFWVLCYLAAGLLSEPAGSDVPVCFLIKCYYKVRQSNETSSSHPKHYSPTHHLVVSDDCKAP